MKKILFQIAFLAIAALTSGQNNSNITIGKTDTIFSKTLNEKRKILVYTPNLTSQLNISGQRYPVLYLLDGEAHFISSVGLVQQLSQANGNSVLPEMIVVGITNTNRFRDLAPSASENVGGNNFMKFIETELMPYIESTYNAAPYKVLAGHSLGGLTAIDVLTKNTNLFNAYIAIDPSMWFEKERFLQNAITQLPNNSIKNKKLFIGTANTMPRGMKLTDLKKDTSNETQHIRSILKLDKFFKASPVPGLTYAHKFYEQETHVSVPLISEYDGLRFIFNFYLMDFSEKDFNDPSDLIVNKYKTHYEKVSKEMGYKIVPPEAFINYLGVDALQKKQYGKAAALFKMNMENFSNSEKAHEAYADVLIVQKDTINAITHYKKALLIKNDPATVLKLSTLQPGETSSVGKDIYIVTEKELEKYVGNYMIEQYQIPVEIKLKNGALIALTSGQSDSELVPVSKDVFTLKYKQGYTLTFHLEADKIIGFTAVQPNGTFKIMKQ